MHKGHPWHLWHALRAHSNLHWWRPVQQGEGGKGAINVEGAEGTEHAMSADGALGRRGGAPFRAIFEGSFLSCFLQATVSPDKDTASSGGKVLCFLVQLPPAF